jgi:hypothetical protein
VIDPIVGGSPGIVFLIVIFRVLFIHFIFPELGVVGHV